MSGRGKVTLVWSHADGGAIRLWNFDIAKHDLKPEHKDGLAQWVLPVLRAGGSAYVVGLASRTGAAAYNKALSQRRADAAVAELRRQLGVAPRVTLKVGLGEETAAAVGDLDERENRAWRAVTAFYYRQAEPPPPARIPPLPPTMVWRYATKEVFVPTSSFAGDRGGGAEGSFAFLGLMLSQIAFSGAQVKGGRRIHVPDNFMITQIDIEYGAGKGTPSSAAAQWDTYYFSWGPRRPTVEVWAKAAKILPVAFPATLLKRITPAQAMMIYERLGEYTFRDLDDVE